jgi:hypothetical protein
VKQIHGRIGLAERLNGAVRLNGNNEAVGSHVLCKGNSHSADVRANIENCSTVGQEVLHRSYSGSLEAGRRVPAPHDGKRTDLSLTPLAVPDVNVKRIRTNGWYIRGRSRTAPTMARRRCRTGDTGKIRAGHA